MVREDRVDLRSLLLGDAGTARRGTDVGLLVLRVTGLGLALAHGLKKLPPGDGFVEGVGAMGFPLPGLFAWAAGLAEFGGILIAVGLLTRPASAAACFTMAIAFFIAHGADPFAKKEMAFLYLLITLALALTGPGRFSIDRLILNRMDSHASPGRPTDGS